MLFKNYSKTFLMCAFGIIFAVTGQCCDGLDEGMNKPFSHKNAEYQEKSDTWDLDILIINAALTSNTKNYLDLLADAATQPKIPITSQSQPSKLADATMQTDDFAVATLIEPYGDPIEPIVVDANTTSAQYPQKIIKKRTYRKRNKDAIGQPNYTILGTRNRNVPERLIPVKVGKSHSTSNASQIPALIAQPFMLELIQDQAQQPNYLEWAKPGDYEREPSTRKKQRLEILSPTTTKGKSYVTGDTETPKQEKRKHKPHKIQADIDAISQAPKRQKYKRKVFVPIFKGNHIIETIDTR